VRRSLAGLVLLLGAALGGVPSAAADTGDTPLGRLNWGVDSQGQPWTAQTLKAHMSLAPDDELSRSPAAVIEAARQHLDDTITPVAALHSEGTVFTDPRHKASAAAVSQLGTVYDWAMCARLAEQPLGQQCASAAAAAITAWTATYQPSGDPIDENQLIPLLQSIDLMMPLLPADTQSQAVAWTSALATQGDQRFAAMKPGDSRLVNNWNSWHLALDAMAGTITGDSELLNRTTSAVRQQVAQNVNADGSTFDFQQRDALHYQVYDLEALLELDLFTSAMPADSEGALLNGLQFLQPFVSGQQQHVEFVGSTVAFDRTRRDAGDPTFANVPWDPRSARTLLRLARSHFPAIRDWTSAMAGDSYPARLRQLAALYAADSRRMMAGLRL